MNLRRARKSMIVALAVAALGVLGLVSSAQAASLNLKCSGKGPQTKAQEYSTASCQVEAGQKRSIEGVLRNDKNKPVASKLKVVLSEWVPQGGGAFDITPYKEFEVKSAANGKFKIPNLTTKTEETVFIEALSSEDAGVSPVTTEVNFQRIVTATVKKQGTSVKVTIKGAAAPLKIGITEEEGYFVSGGAAKKTNKAGVAIFHLGNQHGLFNVFFEAGELTDLYYFVAKRFGF
jgi:hypothetical protein